MREIKYSGLIALVKNKETFVLDIFAEWCNPCKALMPILEKVSKDKKVEVYKIDTDSLLPEQMQDLQFRYSFSSIPCVVFYKNGELKDVVIGLNEESLYINKVNLNLI